MHRATGRHLFHLFVDAMSFRRREYGDHIREVELASFTPLVSLQQGAWAGRDLFSIIAWLSYFPGMIQHPTAGLWHGFAALFPSLCCIQQQCVFGEVAPSLIDTLMLPRKWAL